MRIIPFYYRTTHERFLTNDLIRKFLHDHHAAYSYSSNRAELVMSLEFFAAKTESNAEILRVWLDKSLKEGCKELRVYSYKTEKEEQKQVNVKSIERILDEILSTRKSRHLCLQPPSSTFRIVDYCVSKDGFGTKISLTLYKTVYVKPANEDAYKLNYPIFFDLYPDKKIYIVRGNSKSTVYENSEEPFIFGENMRLSTKMLFEEAIKTVINTLRLTFLRIDTSVTQKEKLYELLVKYTNTPAEITALMSKHQSTIVHVTSELQKSFGFKSSNAYTTALKLDVGDLVEKYFSVSYPDETIFTKGRDAYPLRLIARDEEESVLNEKAGLDKPLQSKEIFFDNKRMMQISHQCDGMWLMFCRIDPHFFTKSFKVELLAKSLYFKVRFKEFTQEEDIQHVLSEVL